MVVHHTPSLVFSLGLPCWLLAIRITVAENFQDSNDNNRAIISREKRPHSPVHGQLQQPPCCFTLFGCGAYQPKRFPLMRALSIPPPAVTAFAAQGRSLAQSRTLIHSPHPSRQFQRWAGTCCLFACVFARNTLYAVHRAEDVQRVYVLHTLCALYGAHSLRALQGFALPLDHSHHHGKNGSVGAESIEGSAMAHYRYNFRAWYHDLAREVPFPAMNIHGIKSFCLINAWNEMYSE